jgi:hypothetical protein
MYASISYSLRSLYLREKSLSYSLDRRMGGPTASTGTVTKIKIPLCWDSKTPVIHLVASNFTKSAIQA